MYKWPISTEAVIQHGIIESQDVFNCACSAAHLPQVPQVINGKTSL